MPASSHVHPPAGVSLVMRIRDAVKHTAAQISGPLVDSVEAKKMTAGESATKSPATDRAPRERSHRRRKAAARNASDSSAVARRPSRSAERGSFAARESRPGPTYR